MVTGRARQDTVLTVVAMTTAAVLIAHHIAGKATRDALFLTYFDVSRLPLMMMASAAVSVAAVLLMSRLLARFGPTRLIPPLYLASALLLVAQWLLSDTRPQLAAAALYLHVSTLNSILISGFWSVINERFDPYSAKTMIARLTAASTFGGLMGGVVSKVVADASDTETILLALGGMHLFCALTVGLLSRGARRQQARGEERPASIFEPMKRSTLIRRMALLGLLVATTAAVLDYILKARAVESFSEEQLITFFSYFYVAVGLGTFLVQTAVGGRALRWLGLGGTMAAWPLVILATGGAALVLRSLASVVLMRASANLLYNSFFRAGFEILYTPIAPADKRAGKVLIDVGADRSGDLVGGLLVMGILLLPAAGDDLLFITALVLASLCLLLILLLNGDYVRQLAANLKNGELRAEDVPVRDATTARTLATTHTAIQRDQLLAEIERYHAQRRPAESPASTGGAGDDAGPVPEGIDRTTEAIITLRSGDPQAVNRILTSRLMTPELIPHVIPLLARDEHLREALRALRKVAPRHGGQMLDALLEPMQNPLVRRRLPLALAHADSALALVGLMAGLEDPDWGVRYRCARALETLRRRNPAFRADRDRLLALAGEEARRLGDESDEPPGETGTADGHGRLDLVFLLLGAAYHPQTLALCREALASDDRALRGTALEYLENRLPAGLWSLLRPRLLSGPLPGRPGRPVREVTRELLEATRRGEGDGEDPAQRSVDDDALD